MSFVAVTEVRQIFVVRHVGFCDQKRAGRKEVCHRSNQTNDLVRFRQMDARRPRFLPQEPDRIQTKDADSIFQIAANDLQKFQQHLRVCEVEINLIMAKRTPNMLDSIRSFRRA